MTVWSYNHKYKKYNSLMVEEHGSEMSIFNKTEQFYSRLMDCRAARKRKKRVAFEKTIFFKLLH